MGLFDTKVNKHLGIDIGTATIKACELDESGGRAILSTYGLATLKNDLIQNGSEEIISEVSEALRQIIEQSGITATHAVAALPAYAVFTFEVDLPKMESDELEGAVRKEAEKSLPVPLSEMVVDWEIIEEVTIEKEVGPEKNKINEVQYRILITAAPRNLVQRYSQIFEGAGIVLESLQTEAMALVTSLIGDDKSPTMILDIGATATDLSLIDGGFPRLSKGVDVGGEKITEAIANNLNVDALKAEQFKRDHGVFSGEDLTKTPEAVKEVIGLLISEIKKALTIFYDNRGKKVEKIVITGGSARLRGFGEYIEKAVGVKVYSGNPWARLETPPKLEASLKLIAPEFAVAVGLAMRNISYK